MRNPEHVAIVGSGISGLTAGIILAKLFYPITVVEKALLAGGMLRGNRHFE